jgi:protein gp37
MVFTCSWSDFFIADADPWRPDAWAIMRRTPNLIYQILTKRPELIAYRLPTDWRDGYPNVWLGVSVENKRFLTRMNTLRRVPATLRFVSAEPLLEDITPELERHVDGFSWVIVGGESGNGGNDFRPMPHQWARNIRDLCQRTGIAFFFKQSAAIRTEMGTTLDGRYYREYPAGYGL